MDAERGRLASAGERVLDAGQRFTLVEHDVLQIARGEYAGWPLA